MISLLTSAILFLFGWIYFHYQAYEKNKLFIRKNIVFIVLGLFSFLFFLNVAFLVNAGSISELDIAINSAIPELRSPAWTQAMEHITQIGDSIFLIILFSIIFIYLILIDFYGKRNAKERFYLEFFLMLVMGLLLDLIVKFLFFRQRPFGGLIEALGFSFPSGHTSMATILFFMLIYFFRKDIKNKFFRASFIFICVLIVFLVGFSRIYLGVHWFSDIIGGFLLGIFSVCSGILMSCLLTERDTVYK